MTRERGCAMEGVRRSAFAPTHARVADATGETFLVKVFQQSQTILATGIK